ncbi:Golgi apparatus membrane protein TVP23 [Mycena sanguinolenta]|uniref:Golgi apparatus membrane protein TVP23 n=1 Tax=Mycena sanguinolenta TaxID=230812 RepID=A0A8H7DDW8_9AGAR|nr:Golgi apparatus membrane protein TVP23 [Mycena sanguinolenta]
MSTYLDGQIEPDEVDVSGNISSTPASNNARPVVLTPTNRVEQMATTQSDAEAGIAGIFRQSAHPLALFFLFFFRIAAIAVYLFSGIVTENYVVITVVVVVLLAMDFWNCRNVSGRTLVGLRFWNQVDEDGESYWVFESRDTLGTSLCPVVALALVLISAADQQNVLGQIAIYVFPLLWVALLIVSLLRFKLTYVPVVVLALVFNVTNAIGFTYADRDSKKRWAEGVVSSGWGLGLGGIGGQIITGAVKKSVSRVLGS